MTRRLAALSLFAAASVASAAPAFVQRAEGAFTSTRAPQPLAMPGPVTTGDTLVIAMSWDIPGDLPRISDNYGNIYFPVLGPISGLDVMVTQQMRLFVAADVTGGPNFTVSYGMPFGTPFDVVQLEYSGISSSDPVDTTAWTADGGLPAIDGGFILATPPVTPRDPSALLLGYFRGKVPVDDAGVGFVARSTLSPTLFEDTVAPTPGPFAATAHCAGSDYLASVLALRPSAATPDGGRWQPATFTSDRQRPTLVQVKDFAIRPSSGTASLRTRATLGDALILVACADAPLLPIVNSTSEVFELVLSTPGVGVWSGFRCEVYVTFAAQDTQTPKVTLSSANGTLIDGVFAEYGGLDPAHPVDTVVSAASGSDLTADSGALTTAYENDLLFGWIESAGKVIAVPDGWDTIADVSYNQGLTQVPGPTGSYAVTAGTESTTWIATLIAFRPLLLDGGSDSPDSGSSPDGGELSTGDGGQSGRRILRVGCDCAEAPSAALLFGALLWLVRLRARRLPR